MSDKAAELAREIRSKRETGEVSFATLHVDDRVLARVTDGIYRRPSSAFRELISNAYDADASEVIIQTDAPRFERIVVRDNGAGMSPETLADLVNHIGGSSKRTAKGKRLQTVNPSNPALSVGGRRLIGKIGIGLFSVAQITQHFQVITKRKGDSYRTVAEILLKTHTEEKLADADAGDSFQTGSVEVTSEPAADLDTQGTEIILMNLRPQARELLQSLDRWSALDRGEEGSSLEPPSFHIGRIEPGNPDKFLVGPSLPWTPQDKPEDKFRKLYLAVRQEVRTRRETPNIEESLDSYLGMLWLLSLAVPIRYIDGHPYDLTSASGIGFYSIGLSSVEEVPLGPGVTIGKQLGLASPKDPVGGFSVIVDDVELLRPVAFDSLLHGNSGIGRPLMFFGKVRSPLGKVAPELGGGGLAFEAYFYWNQKITPKENNGCLVRVNNASGVLFDKSFLNYQVSELTRLRQLMSEVFITEGLDAALNIDRESFNFSHPHYQYLQKWVHYAVRQVTNRLKLLNRDYLDRRRQDHARQEASVLASHLQAVWQARRGTDAELPPEVRIVAQGQRELVLADRERGVVVLAREAVLPTVAPRGMENMEARLEGLVQVLSAYGLLEGLSYADQESLVADILAIFAPAG